MARCRALLYENLSRESRTGNAPVSRPARADPERPWGCLGRGDDSSVRLLALHFGRKALPVKLDAQWGAQLEEAA